MFRIDLKKVDRVIAKSSKTIWSSYHFAEKSGEWGREKNQETVHKAKYGVKASLFQVKSFCDILCVFKHQYNNSHYWFR